MGILSCCSNPFITQIWGGPPLGPPDPGRQICYWWLDETIVSGGIAGEVTLTSVEINGVDYPLPIGVGTGIALFDPITPSSSVPYSQMIVYFDELATAAGVIGTSFFNAAATDSTVRFSLTGENITSIVFNYSWDNGGGAVPVSRNVTNSVCFTDLRCYEASVDVSPLTTGRIFLSDTGVTFGTSYTGQTFPALFQYGVCAGGYIGSDGGDPAAVIAQYQDFIRCLTGSQASVVVDVQTNVLTVTIRDSILEFLANGWTIDTALCTLLDSGTMNFNQITCP